MISVHTHCFSVTVLLLWILLILYFLARFQTREVLHYSEDEDAVIVGSLDFCSEYIDDCPWVSDVHYTPQRVRGQPDGCANNKDTVFLQSFMSLHTKFGLKPR